MADARDSEERDAETADRLFDETVRRMLKTPPKPHEAMKLGKPRRNAIKRTDRAKEKPSESRPD